jgi:hypothetical protein
MPINPNANGFNPDAIVYYRHGNTNIPFLLIILKITLLRINQVLSSKIPSQAKELVI